jgi:Na+/proline symporter
LLGLDPYMTVVLAALITMVYSTTAGLWGVVVTDFFQFVLAMIGSLAAAYYAVSQPSVGGLGGLMSSPLVKGKLPLLPDFSDATAVLAVLIVPLAVQWWSTWYPGSEPGGGGYIAQRMLAARNEKQAMAATLWFNIAHYALRPWPWILVALASLIVYPELSDIQARFPHLDPSIVRHDLAYPAMLVFVPHGLLGLVVASLAAAYMSTISTHLNWGASYVVDDVYRRFIQPDASELHYVNVGRGVTVALMILAALVALWLKNAMQAFQILLQIGAGTGLIFLLRWYWWRINAWGEIAAMVISFLLAAYLHFGHARLGFAPLHPTAALVPIAPCFSHFTTRSARRPQGGAAPWIRAVGETRVVISQLRFSPGFSAASSFTRHCLQPDICSTGASTSAFFALPSPSPRLMASGKLSPR